MVSLGIIDILLLVIIGIIEGITEWLPVSSTGHMLLFDNFFKLNASEEFKEVFFVVIQLGAIIAVIVMFFSKLWPFSLNKEEKYIKKDIFNIWFKVIVACIPSAILGLFLDDILEKYFGNAVTISIMLILYGIFFIVVEKYKNGKEFKFNSIEDISYKVAVLIGLFQVLAMIPGTSRSGATIIGALLLGVSRVAAAEFTFFLAIPTMFGASLLKIVKFGFDFTSSEIIALIIGSVVAFVVSLIAIKFLMDFVKKHSFTIFGYYRIILGIIVIITLLIK